MKYLGVILDQFLSGEEHVLTVISKISARISFLFRNSHLLTSRCRQILCTALIQPYFDYCCTSWYTGLSARHKSKLDVLQRKMVRLVFKMEPRDHVGQDSLSKLGWFTVPNRVRYFKLIHMFKIHSKTAPNYMVDNFKPVSSIHDYHTRQSQLDYHLNKYDSIGLMSNSFRFSAIKEWNALPIGIRTSPNVTKFKGSLKTFLLNN